MLTAVAWREPLARIMQSHAQPVATEPTDAAAASPARTGEGPDPVDLENPALYINRELSWLEFNQRVLLQAQDERHPLLERVQFLSIVFTNLDEFFMVRVATLLRKVRTESEAMSPDGMSTEQQLAAFRVRTKRMMDDVERCCSDVLRPLLAAHRIRILDPDDYAPAVEEYLHDHYRRNIHPVLTPLAFDPGHPFPFISNLSMNLAVVVEQDGRTRFARVKLPDVLARFIPIPARLVGEAGDTFALLEDVVKLNIANLFPRVAVRETYLFRIIRDTDMVIQEDEADDLLESVDRTLKELRYGDLSQLLVEASMPSRVLNILVENFEIEEDVVVRTAGRMGIRRLERADQAAPPAVEGQAVLAARAVAGRGRRGHLQRRPGAGSAGPPSVRVVLGGRIVPARGRRRRRHRGHQDHPLPHRSELAAPRPADPGRRTAWKRPASTWSTGCST